MEVKEEVYVGIDVGKEGAIAVIGNNKLLYKTIMPKINKKEVDIGKFARTMLAIRKKYNVKHVTFEALHAIFRVGASATFGLGFQAGMVEGVVNSLGLPYTKLKPSVWQKEMWSGIQLIEKSVKFEGKVKQKVDTKAVSASAAKRLFPKESFVAKGCRTDHDGMIDAALIAKYSERKGL